MKYLMYGDIPRKNTYLLTTVNYLLCPIAALWLSFSYALMIELLLLHVITQITPLSRLASMLMQSWLAEALGDFGQWAVGSRCGQDQVFVFPLFSLDFFKL